MKSFKKGLQSYRRWHYNNFILGCILLYILTSMTSECFTIALWVEVAFFRKEFVLNLCQTHESLLSWNLLKILSEVFVGWHHWLDGCESEWTPGVGDGQGGLACCDSWGRKESDTTELLIWSDLMLWIQKVNLQEDQLCGSRSKTGKFLCYFLVWNLFVLCAHTEKFWFDAGTLYYCSFWAVFLSST